MSTRRMSMLCMKNREIGKQITRRIVVGRPETASVKGRCIAGSRIEVGCAGEELDAWGGW